YWSNAQYLNAYVVEGDFNGSGPKANRNLFKNWIRWQYPAMYVEYKGRGSEWFSAEIPVMFDWMNRKRRYHPAKQLGRKDEEFKIMRETDNRYYWLGADGISPKCITSYSNWVHHTLPATLAATIHTPSKIDLTKEGGTAKGTRIWNQINVQTSGVKQVSLYPGPNTIDFPKPLVVTINSTSGPQMKVHASIQTLLEELFYQGDRQRLVYGKLDFKV